MNAHLEVVVTPAPRIDPSQLVPAHGTAPKCVHCPSPKYSGPGAQDRIEGTVALSALVGLDGRARDIDIVQPLSHGLTEQAIAAVESWTLVPAKSADGKPLEIKTLFEVTFKLK
jgi:TonB family protein